jgi:glycine/D-amino acid oxidase-like deaminating enzyme
MSNQADVIIVGGGLAGLVAAAEVADAGKRAIIVEQEGEQSLGGQAFWSLGGLFLVDSPEQRRLRIRDSHELALQDWLGKQPVVGLEFSDDMEVRMTIAAPADEVWGVFRTALSAQQQVPTPTTEAQWNRLRDEVAEVRA